MLPPFTGSILRPRAVGILIPGEATEATLELLRARREAQATEAWNHGQAAFAAGDLPSASRWLDRARRIAPDDQTVALVLALVRLRQGSAEAAALFEAVLSRHDLRTAWLGLAQARRLAGDHDAAAVALGAALSRHAAPVDAALTELAGDIAAAAGAPGWCALDDRQNLTVVASGTVAAPPAAWRNADRLELLSDGVGLIGSPLALDRIRTVEGCVAAEEGGLQGWAWHPADPDRDPTLRIVPQSGRALNLIAHATDAPSSGHAPLARPRRFQVSATALAGLRGPLRVIGADHRDLLGSPLDPGAERRSAAALARLPAMLYPAGRRARPLTTVPSVAPVAADIRGLPATAGAERPVAVVVPVYRGLAQTKACLDSVFASVTDDVAIVVVDDAGPDPALTALLDRLAASGRIRLLRHATNQGFPASANAGMRACKGADIVLLNSDTLVAPGWLAALAGACRSARDIGTATPLSNDATIVSYPRAGGGNDVPDLAATRRLSAQARRANGAEAIDIPTAIGFCMYIRRDCLDQVGLFRPDLFAQGYGEENDFCLRARHLGWRHVAATGVFVGHVGGKSFGAARHHLLARNMAVLDRLHPGYAALIAGHQAADPLAEARRRLDLARWPPARGRRAVLLITHDMGGGVERQLAVRIRELAASGWRPIVLRPDLHQAGICRIEDGLDRGFPNLRFAVPAELPALAGFLRAQRPDRAELHHFVGHDPAVPALCRELGLPYEVHIHDWAWFCPRISLIGPERRYCGEPDAVHCETCVADAGRNIDEDISVAALRARSTDDLGRATRVVAPSADAAARIGRHFPGVAATPVAWDTVRPAVRPPARRRARMRVCLIGAIGTEKGYDVLLACARDAARRGLPLDFVVVGYTVDDARLLATGAVFVTGEYRPAELPDLLAQQAADLAWLPSIWPETWCFTLSEAWQAGLDVVAFDIGAPAERIRACGGGLLLPLGLPPASINNTLLSRRLALCSVEPTAPDGKGPREAALGATGPNAGGGRPLAVQ